MMIVWLLLPVLAGCLSLGPSESDRNFLEACGQLQIGHFGPQLGVLSGQCDGHDVSLDLHDCLAWSQARGLHAQRGGNLRQSCQFCGIIGDGGPYRSNVPGFIECKCQMTKNLFNLVGTVTINDHGSLQCNAPGIARPESTQTEPSNHSRNVTEACDDFELDPEDGWLAGKCDAKPEEGLFTAETAVNLNTCLAWGSSNGQSPGLFSAKDGNFTDNCNSCVLFDPGRSTTPLGFIQCQCAHDVSKAKSWYYFDLHEIVTVSDLGQLQCVNTTGTVLTSLAIRDHYGISDSIVFADDASSCEEQIKRIMERHPEWLPERYGVTKFEACPDDPSMCCFFPKGGDGWLDTEGFEFIRGNQMYWYRIHYQSNTQEDGYHHNRLSAIFRFCDDPDMCPDGETSPPVADLVEQRGLRENTTCEEQIRKAMKKWPRLLPRKLNGTVFEACPSDTSTCCFRPDKSESFKEGFKLIQASEFVYYRLHFKKDNRRPEEGYSRLSMVYRICQKEKKDVCPEPDTPGPRDPHVTATRRSKKSSTQSRSTTQSDLLTSFRTGTLTAERGPISTSSSRRNSPRTTPTSSQDVTDLGNQESKESTKVVTVTLPPNTDTLCGTPIASITRTLTWTLTVSSTSKSTKTDEKYPPLPWPTTLDRNVETALPTSVTSGSVAGVPDLIFPTPPYPGNVGAPSAPANSWTTIRLPAVSFPTSSIPGKMHQHKPFTKRAPPSSVEPRTTDPIPDIRLLSASEVMKWMLGVILKGSQDLDLTLSMELDCANWPSPGPPGICCSPILLISEPFFSGPVYWGDFDGYQVLFAVIWTFFEMKPAPIGDFNMVVMFSAELNCRRIKRGCRLVYGLDSYRKTSSRVGDQTPATPTTTKVPFNHSNLENVPNTGDGICSGLLKKAVCCKGALLGLIYTGCAPPTPVPDTPAEFVEQCSDEGKQARCCSLNLMGHALLCKAAYGDPRATVDGYEYDSHNLFALPPKTKSTKDVTIDLSKLDVGELIENMLGATNIQDVHRAEIDLTVQAKCESKNGVTGCSDLVIEMSGTPLLNADLEPRALAARATPPETKTATTTIKTKTRTKTKSKTKTRTTTKVVTQTSTAPSKKTVTLTTTIGSNGTTTSRYKKPTGLNNPEVSEISHFTSRLATTRDLIDTVESTAEPTLPPAQ